MSSHSLMSSGAVDVNVKRWAAGQFIQEHPSLHVGSGKPIYQYVMTYRRVLSGLSRTPCHLLISLFSPRSPCSLWLEKLAFLPALQEGSFWL